MEPPVPSLGKSKPTGSSCDAYDTTACDYPTIVLAALPDRPLSKRLASEIACG